jgi:soluble lytic murein transglycosylase-like protein
LLRAGVLALLVLLGGSHADPSHVRRELIDDLLATHARAIGRAERAALVNALLAVQTEFAVDSLLVLAVIEQESRYDPAARGLQGGLGLMQLKLPAARAGAERAGMLPPVQEHELLRPPLNVRLGTAYLASMKEQFGDWSLALTGYNMGPVRLQQMLDQGRQPRFRYATPVLARWQELRDLERQALAERRRR